MAITVGNFTESTGTYSAPVSISHTINTGDNRCLVVGVTVSNARGVTLTWDGTSMTEIDNIYEETNYYRTFIFYLIAPKEGTYNVELTCTSTCSYYVGIGNFYGVRQTDTIDATAKDATGTDNPFSKSLTTNYGNSMIVNVAGCINTTNITTATGSLTKRLPSSSSWFGYGTLLTTSSGEYTTGWNTSADVAHAMVITSIRDVIDPISGPAKLKTRNGLTLAQIKTINGLEIAKIKTLNGLS